jgi:murein DD-endopeptidase MepM/ murein hydrolase activator NlpD
MGRVLPAAIVLAFASVAAPAGAQQAPRAKAVRRARPENRADARARELGLGTRVAASKLLIGPAPEPWVRAAGGKRPRGLLWPVSGGILWRGYGSGHGGRHRALDIGAPEGTPIRASADGVVAYADDTVRGYGNLIFIVHGNGWVTSYAHASKILVRPGQRVERGDTIAEVGHTGIARGDHVHFEFRRDGRLGDPIDLFAGGPPPIPRRLLIEAGRIRYRVQRGDTLVEIGRRFHVSPDRLRSLNGIPNARSLRVGQDLQVPRMVVRGRRRPQDPPPAIGGPDPVEEGEGAEVPDPASGEAEASDPDEGLSEAAAPDAP